MTRDLLAARPPRIALLGNPNSGKTTLFNLLSGSNERVSNYAGVTVERVSATLQLAGMRCELVDIPGLYSLAARSPEESIAVQEVLGHKPDRNVRTSPADSATAPPGAMQPNAVKGARSGGQAAARNAEARSSVAGAQATAPAALVLVVPAPALRRGLYLALQALTLPYPVTVVVTLNDEVEAAGLRVDASALADALGVPVLLSQGRKVDALALKRVLASLVASERPARTMDWPQAAAEAIARVSKAATGAEPATHEGAALIALLSWNESQRAPLGMDPSLFAAAGQVTLSAEARGLPLAERIIETLYAEVDRLASQTLVPGGKPSHTGLRLRERLDTWLKQPLLGFLSLAAVLLGLFHLLFTAAEPVMGLIETGIGGLQTWLGAVLPPGFVASLLIDGVLAGVGNVVVFVPQIALLFLLLGALEDTGYLARVAFLLDRPLRRFGLQGKAVVPLLSGFACAIPAILATRTLPRFRDRLLTMLAIPYVACAARLPVFLVIAGVLFSDAPPLLGVSRAAWALLAMYTLSVSASLAAAWVFSKVLAGRSDSPLLLDLPPLRWPKARNLLRLVRSRVKSFLKDAGTIILALTVILWALLSFPQAPALPDGSEASAGEQLRYSVGGRAGIALEPLWEPMGVDWRIGLGIISAFAAREVFVSTLGVVFGLESADEDSGALRNQLSDARTGRGAPLLTTASGLAVMVFFVLACQCMSTLAVVRRESGTVRWPIIMFSSMTLIAYAAACLTYWLLALVTGT